MLEICAEKENLIKTMSEGQVLLAAIKINEYEDIEQADYTLPPYYLTESMMGLLANSASIGSGHAIAYPAETGNLFLAHKAWRFKEPIPVQDTAEILAIFHRMNELNLPTSDYFIELYGVENQTHFNVFSPDYSQWREELITDPEFVLY